jgi:hypothetical protein
MLVPEFVCRFDVPVPERLHAEANFPILFRETVT